MASAGSYLRVASWNMLHAGWNNHQDWNAFATQMWQDFGTGASSANGVDIIFGQEVMYDSAATQINAALESISGQDWSYRVTHKIGRSSYKERYAVWYRPSRVQILSAYVWSDSGDHFEREPHIVKVRHKQTGADYSFINWHTVFGTAAKRRAEIAKIAEVFASVQNSSGSDQDVILLGDHNRDANSNYWDNLKSLSPTVSYKINDKTSINTSCSFVSRYDHFWMQTNFVTEYSSSGLDYISDRCDFRQGVSDHSPIWMKLYSNSDTD